MDKNYQKKRKENARRGDANAGAKLVRNFRGLGMGVFDGVTGVVLQPISGAKEEGFGGFLKGVGKGMVGLVSKPTSGVFDFASSSLDMVRRVADNQGVVHRIRPPRFLEADGTIRPYSRQTAEGNEVLQNVDKGKYAVTDTYVAHLVTEPDGKTVFLVTSARMMLARKTDILGNWEIEWEHVLEHFIDAAVEAGQLKLTLKRTDSSPVGVAKLFSNFRGAKSQTQERIRIVKVQNRAQAEWLKMKLVAARQAMRT
ncbi:unnamed protein product [Notodromas monacha]|uniref:Intermembrane lipid transfer protein VPS13-like C-terminal domain-containing protein n=1 Tax=Notodromas monacha TaxID=399045 RepID=A0A7R9BNS1_9CRUS|nr:unnamed protein product [Notodromas monacha]CAG0918882.1 unnamed protein product [Notodromas monacha]